jgi:hypothetical protein
MVPIGCPETLEINYQYALRNSREERSSHLRRDGSLKSAVGWWPGYRSETGDLEGV